MISNTLYFVQLNKELHDGGLSRNLAFYEYYKSKGAKVQNVFHRNKIKRIFISISILRIFLTSKSKTIFIHQGTIIYLFPMSLLKYNLVFRSIFRVLQYAASKNRLIIEVNDLPHEQAIDLELPLDPNYRKFEEALYTLKRCYYIFASQQMNNYIKEKFKILDGYSEAVINGSTKLNYENKLESSVFEKITQSNYKCVYAGTLNKGRQIETLIDLFSELKNVSLILLGDWGEWLNNYKLPFNVIYLGNKNHDIAQQIVSKCDLGLIQYSADRFYYNLCFPTKISFYLTAGLPVLTTPLTELKTHFSTSECVYFVEFDQWKTFLLSMDTDFINKSKLNAKIEGEKYEWASVLSYSKFLNIQ